MRPDPFHLAVPSPLSPLAVPLLLNPRHQDDGHARPGAPNGTTCGPVCASANLVLYGQTANLVLYGQTLSPTPFPK